MPLKYKYPQAYTVHFGRRAAIRIDFEDIRTDENAAFKPLIDYWLRQPLIGFHLVITIEGDSVSNALHRVPMVNYITDKQKVVQAEWGKVDVPHGAYDIYTTVQPQALPNERIILRRDGLKVV